MVEKDLIQSVGLKNPADRQNYRILRYFNYSHLPEDLQKVSKPFAALATHMVNNLPDSPEKHEGLRKLLEAKDCMVRAKIMP